MLQISISGTKFLFFCLFYLYLSFVRFVRYDIANGLYVESGTKLLFLKRGCLGRVAKFFSFHVWKTRNYSLPPLKNQEYIYHKTYLTHGNIIRR